MSSAKFPTFWVLGLLAGAYILLGLISLPFAITPGNASAIWPAAGLAVAGCVLYGYRVWPAIWVGATIVASTNAVGMGTATVIGMGNTLEALIATWLIKRYTKIDTHFHESVDVFRFVVFALAGSVPGSLIGATSLLAGDYIPMNEYPQTWITWFLGDLTGIAIVAPAIMTSFARSKHHWDRRVLAEIALFALAFGLCGIFVFFINTRPLLFLFLPLIAWLAFRFSQSEVAKANVVLSMIAVGGTLSDAGPLAALPINSALLVLQIFVSVVGITGLALAVTVDERRQAALTLEKMQDKLEVLIEQRTEQLEKSVDALQHGIRMHEKAQQDLLAKEKQLEEAQRLAHLGSWEWDAVNDHMIMSKEMMRIYGVPSDEQDSLNYKKYLKYIPDEECPLVDRIVRTALESKLPFSYEHHVIRPDGAIRYLRCTGMTESDEAGKPIRLYGTAHDLTDEKALENNLRETEERYRKLVELSPDAIYLLHEGLIAFSNAAGLKLIGAASVQDVIGRAFLDFIAPEFRLSATEALQQLIRTGHLASIEGKVIRLDAEVIDIELAATPFSIGGAQDTLLVARDISERKKAEQQIQYLAHYDILTGLANRVLFKERLEHAIYQSHRSNKPLVILFVDLDRFKSINDTSGHSAGDQVLRECAQRLRNCLREGDTFARAGGDEFLILIESVSDQLNVPAVVQKIIMALSQPFYVDGKEFSISASIGISSYPADGGDVETLIKHADIAMYQAKTEGGSHFRYYLPSMTRRSLERHAMESKLRRALERGEMELYYQPKISLSTGLISGAEALIRWNHPEYGLLLPHRFVSLAEDTGLIADIGLWAIREVCGRSRDWQRQGLQEVRIAVNLSYSQFSDKSFFNTTEKLLRDYGVSPGVLELEITETMAMENAESLMSTLQRLKQLGIHLSVDDFGTGYSSLAYLKRLPVDSVKVDRSFIKDLPFDNEDVAITHAVLALVHSLKRSVVAEGVETREQLQFLIENGCDEVQGFYFSPPLPEKEFRRFLADEKCFLADLVQSEA